jgi:ADP-ribose pyrophosphatase YjhB (NUDIX family)
MDCGDHLRALESFIPDPRQGLPEDVFLFVSRLTPLVNVDLLIQDNRGSTLLTWRDDGSSPAGWHVPGGIVRYLEPAAQRIRAVARGELHAEVAFDPSPLALHELIDPTREVRGHFLSLLFRCRLLTPLEPLRRHDPANPKPDSWAWHASFPERMIPAHGIYRRFL